MAEQTKKPFWYKADLLSQSRKKSQVEGIVQAKNEDEVHRMVLQIAASREVFPQNILIVPQTVYSDDWQVITEGRHTKDTEPKYLPSPSSPVSTHPKTPTPKPSAHNSASKEGQKPKKVWYPQEEGCMTMVEINSKIGYFHFPGRDIDTFADHLKQEGAI